MRRRTRPVRYEHSPAKLFVASVTVLVGFFALLIAAAYPVAAVAAVGGAASVPVTRRAVGLFRDSEGVRVPGTDLCLPFGSA